MKLVNANIKFGRPFYDKIPEQISLRTEREVEEIKNEMERKYGVISNIAEGKILQFMKMINSLLRTTNGKTILDIGCGAKESWDYLACSDRAREDRYYDPWLCRALKLMGATSIGVDGGESPSEEYKHITAHLYRFDEVAQQFKDNSIDLACAWNFFDSPNLLLRREVFEAIIKGLERKLKPEGFFVFESTGTGLTTEESWNKYLTKGE